MDYQELRQRHVHIAHDFFDSGVCNVDGELWPCTVMQLLSTQEELVAVLEDVLHDYDAWGRMEANRPMLGRTENWARSMLHEIGGNG